jgi:hypothetical protein
MMGVSAVFTGMTSLTTHGGRVVLPAVFTGVMHCSQLTIFALLCVVGWRMRRRPEARGQLDVPSLGGWFWPRRFC